MLGIVILGLGSRTYSWLLGPSGLGSKTIYGMVQGFCLHNGNPPGGRKLAHLSLARSPDPIRRAHQTLGNPEEGPIYEGRINYDSPRTP